MIYKALKRRALEHKITINTHYTYDRVHILEIAKTEFQIKYRELDVYNRIKAHRK